MADESSASSSQDSENSCGPPPKRRRYSWERNENSSETRVKCAHNLAKIEREASCSSYGRLNVARLVTSNNYPVFKWQTRQIAKAVVDNTINKVIEDMGFVPFAHELMDDMFPMRHRDEHVEDEAVLMAIQSHGLQQKDWTGSCSHSKSSEVHPNSSKNWYEYENDENTNAVAATNSDHKQVQTNSNEDSVLGKPEPSTNNSSVVQSEVENKATQNPVEDNTSDGSIDNILDKNVFEHDFLAQAVAVAIQKKGLGTFLANESS